MIPWMEEILRLMLMMMMMIIMMIMMMSMSNHRSPELILHCEKTVW